MKPLLRALLLPIAAAVLVLSGAAPGAAQQDGSPVSIGTYRVIASDVLGEARRLLINLPRGYEGSAISYPVVYHTYGDYISEYYADAFATLERLGNSARTPQLILVGIDNIDRYRDLRPLTPDGRKSGTEAYTRFLREEVIPFVERNYRTTGFRILVGPQAGAIFGLYTLQENTDLFDAYILNNPFVSKPNTESLLSKAATFYENQDELRKFVFITFGGADESPGDVANVYRFAEFTAPVRDRGFELHLNNLLENDDFITPLDLRKGLETLFEGYHVGEPRRFTSLQAISAHYEDLSARYGFGVPPAELVMTLAADALRTRGETEKAVEILEYQTSLYPNMVNAYWQLAGIAAEKRDTATAIGLYEKCLEINPSLANFVARRIEELRGARP